MAVHAIRKSLSVLGAAALAGALPLVMAAAPASAGPVISFTVNTTADLPDALVGDGICADTNGQCTLRAAIQESDAQPVGAVVDITVPAGTYVLVNGILPITRNTVVLTGAGAPLTIVKDGPKSHTQLFSVAAKSSASLSGVTLENAKTGRPLGGALANAGTTTLISDVVTGNTAKSGGGLSNGKGAILTLTGSTVSNNHALSATVNSTAGGSGGGISNAGTLHLTSTTVSGNYAGTGGFGSTDPGGHGGNGGGIASTGTVTVASSTVSGNQAGTGGYGLSGNESSGPGGNGGGIYESGGLLTITNSTVSSNTSGYGGPSGEVPFPPAGDGGGIWTSGSLQVTGATFSSNAGGGGNAIGGSGGAIFTSGTATISSSAFTGNTGGGEGVGGNGGAIANSGSLTLTSSTLTDNVAGAGGGSSNGGNGGGLYSAGSATVTGDLFSGNSGGAGGNAIPVDPGCSRPGYGGSGGAIYSLAAVQVANTTISGNAVGAGGFLFNPCAGEYPSGVGAGIANAGGVDIVSYSTIADNTDGIDNLSGTITLSGTIVADSTGVGDSAGSTNCTGAISEGTGYNLDSGTTCGFSAAGDITGTEPLLGQLANSGGPTETQALLSGSPAIDAGGTVADGCPATDQRGLPRPDDAADNGACDMGSFESQGIG